ncbi:MAG: CHAT domain-containing protein [Bacteroidales bacterium]|nr:CHAT domain-containing protein [Bacteroidales bacterium]
MSRSFLIFIIVLAFCSAMNPAQAQSASELYDQANELYDEGRYKEAEKLFLKVLELFENQYGREHKETLRPINRLGRTYSQLRENEKALHYLQEAFGIAQKLYGSESAEAAYRLIDIGHVYSQLYEPDKANKTYNQALKLFKKLFGKVSSKTANVLMNIGSAYQKKGDYLDAERYYLRAFEIFSKVSEPGSEDFNRIYSNMGYIYRKKGDLEKALDFGQKALEIKLKNYEPTHPSVGKYYRNIGRVYEEMNRMEEALPYMQKALEISESSLGNDHPHTAGAYGEVAHIHAAMRQYDTALRIYQRSIQLLENTLPADHPYVVAGYFNIATVYNELGLLKKALEYYHVALQKLLSRTFRPGNLVAQAYRDLASVHFRINEFDSALIYCQRGLEAIATNFVFQDGEYFANPSIAEVQAQIEFLGILGLKAELLEELYNLKSSEITNLEEALNTTLLAVQLIEDMRLGYQSESSRQYLSSGTSGIFKTGVRVAMQLYQETGNKKYLWQAFGLSEKSKAIILWRSMNESSAIGAAGLPESEREAIANLEQRFAILEEEVAQFDEGVENDINSAVRSELFNVKLEYDKLIKSLEKTYPDFYELRYAPPVVTQENLIRKINGSQLAVLSYFYDDTAMYIFLFDKDGLKGYAQPLISNFTNTITSIREFDLSDLLGMNSGADRLAYLQQLNDLYMLLVEPVRNRLAEQSNLLIIPHGILNYLPFEMLIERVDGSDFRQQPYLIHDFTIQYAWSAALWAKEIQPATASRLSFAGFAPSFAFSESEPGSENTYRSTLANLTFSSQEIKDAQKMLGGKVFIDEVATKSSFRLYAPASRVLHLATHAIVNNEKYLKSGLSFAVENGSEKDDFLYAYEIYNLKLSAEMAVMSACNTGFGKIAEGEGVMSLGRAFFYAGCKSIIMSQWLANDRTTYELMDNFYQKIVEGQTKDQALRNAKIEHLTNADALTAHPYFWAGMIAVGDMRPLTQEQTIYKWIWIFAALVLGGLMILVFKRRF